MKLKYTIDLEKEVPFRNKMDFCVGTGRMGLALHKEYLDQLQLVQEKIGFSFIRGHGIFCDDMGIYQEHTDSDGQRKGEYNFTYLDRVFDSYQELKIRPFIEFGFMPYTLAAGSQTQFYWKGNVTPPRSYQSWRELIQATLGHLISRYGEQEVLTWPIEVWNEPNLKGFWKDADMEEYIKLYECTARAVKDINVNFQVGGPAICGGSDDLWMHGFLKACRKKKLAIDFITRHHYMIDKPVPAGHYEYAEVYGIAYGFSSLKKVRKIIEEYPEYKDLPFHITEFNTAYIPNCPLHDTNQNAAYLARVLSEIGDYCDSYSYWTFGDVFEEQGIPYTPFHGGFGLVAGGCIPKPTFWTFQFYKHLQGRCVLRTENAVFVRKEDGTLCGIAWNLQTESNAETIELEIEIPAKVSEYSVLKRIVDEDLCNPLKVWHDMGEPSSLSSRQLEFLKEAAVPHVISARKRAEKDFVTLELRLNRNAVVYIEGTENRIKSDRGYTYEKASSSPLFIPSPPLGNEEDKGNVL